MTAKSLKCSVTAALLSMLVPKTPFKRGQRKLLSQKSKFRPQKIFLSDLVLILLNLLVFESLAWKISSNWRFQRNVGFDLKRAQTSEHCYMWRNIRKGYNKVLHKIWGKLWIRLLRTNSKFIFLLYWQASQRWSWF